MVADATSNTTHFFLGRQPILDRQGDIHGYELLFRSSADNRAIIGDDHKASVQVIARAFGELGLDAVLGDGLGFVNMGAELLGCELIESLPQQRMVLEILETTEFSPEIVTHVRLLHEKGYRLALDDIVALHPAHRDVLPYISYLKVDVLDMPDASIVKLTDQLRPLGVNLLAEKVETRRQADFCRQLGYSYFQGYYFARPEVMSGKTIDASHRQMLRVSKLLMGDAADAEIEKVLKEDSKLTYNLLRLVNSVAMGLRTRINSVRQAMQMLGRRQLQRWLSLLLFASKGGPRFPDPLAIMAACRGRMMENLARAAGKPNETADQAFMTGMMSLLEAVLEIPMARIVEELNLAQEIRDALLDRGGMLGELLRLSESTERYDTEGLSAQLAQLGLTLDQLTAAEIDAMTWANAIGKEA